ncbi:hypothetical protein [Deinococcus deserti]|uniref:Uncharacterized protein n=1 Tax=Deinococcus deserti (strain DSM 17065 / CIP 109153 / LMG 22923 / VCD115) TaxID=546414 RepID=C1CXN4_DEIDV|nr:hypothetical protein [Deinococcus deserti]ACO44840.1 Hypothetical protein Deide_00420 [Deinococcus deserti VCD115]
MKKHMLLSAVPALMTLLGACAPAQTGGALTPEVLTTPLSVVKIQPGQTRYVQLIYPRSAISVNDKYFNDLRIDFDNVNGGKVNSVEHHAGWLRLKASNLPQGVNVRLDRAAVMKETTRTEETRLQTTVSYYERVKVVLKVSADADARAVALRVAELTYSDGITDSDVPLSISVVASN